jgi:hypothetical protein
MIGKQYIEQIDPNIAAEAFSNGLLAQLTSNGGVEGGNIGKTTHIVLKSTTGIVQLGSGGDGNEVVFYQDGDDFANNVVKTRVFLSKGQVHIENGCQDGTVITSTQGICGASSNGVVTSSNVSPMPLGNEGFAGRQFFLFAFRSSNNPLSQSRGEVYVAAGAVSSEVSLLSGDGQTVVDGPYTIPPYGLKTFLTDGNSEFQVVASQNVFVGIAANMGAGTPTFYDMRLVPPLATNLIGQNRNARLSALYDNTEVWWYRQNGQIGKLIVSPGSPVQIYNQTRNLLGDVFNINSNTTPATSGTFTITVNGETTSNIVYNANSSQILTALSGLASYSEADFIVEMTRGDNLGQSNSQATIYCQGLLERVVGTPSINNTNIVGNSHVYNLQQAGNVAPNAGNDGLYSKEGVIHLEAKNGVISCLSGADGSGLEATYYMPTQSMTQVVPLYLCTTQSGSGASSSIAIQSLYKGNFKIYDQNNVLKYSGSFDRGITADSGARQLIPTGITIAGSGQDIAFTEDFLGGYIESDVPINIVFNSDENQDLITGGIPTEADEIVMYGVTPNDIRTVFRKLSDGFTYKQEVEALADPNPIQGFIDYNDTTGAVSLVADTWTTIPNNGAGAFSNNTYAPSNVSDLMDVSTGEIDPRQLELGDTIFIRNDYSINPNTNNAELEFRYILGDGAGEYTLQTTIGRLDDGSGVDYRFSLKPDLIYMGDTNTRDNLITLQVKLSSNGTLTNAGSVVQVIKGNARGSQKWVKI